MSKAKQKQPRVGQVDTVIAAQIRHTRQQLGLSQSAVARALGVSFQQFQKYEQGENRVSAVRLIDLSKALNTTPHDILQWENNPSEEEIRNARCRVVDRKAADLWHTIQNQRHRRALIMMMEAMGNTTTNQQSQDGTS